MQHRQKNGFRRVLAIETSCDDTSIALVKENGWVESIKTANQDKFHKDFGGIVPEVAGRNHTLAILPLIEETLQEAELEWSDIDGIAVTNRPGLVGSLLVGLITAKTLSMAKNIPFIGVNHLEAHLLAPFLRDSGYAPPEGFTYPYVALAISGGHTQLYYIKGLGQYEIMGATLDDAAGEAFDKFAKCVGLGFPGGVQVDRYAKQGNPKAFDFPRSMLREEGYRFSFSGLKAAGMRKIESMSPEQRREKIADLCASYQEAIVDVLLAKLDRATENLGLTRAVLTGGVSANSRLRERAQEWAKEKGYEVVIPPIRYCTDNAAMVGYVGIQRLNQGEFSEQGLGPSPKVYPADFSSYKTPEFSEASDGGARQAHSITEGK